MKKLVVAGVSLATTLIVVRRFGPALARRAMSKCELMFDNMPEDFPPKRMMRGIEEIRTQNSAILSRIDEGSTALTAVSGQRR